MFIASSIDTMYVHQNRTKYVVLEPAGSSSSLNFETSVQNGAEL